MKTEDKRLEEAKEGVLEYFRKIAAVPHDSGHEGALAREMREWLKNVNGVSTIDDAGNLICDIPATPGCENAPLLMLQGHIDMVCAFPYPICPKRTKKTCSSPSRTIMTISPLPLSAGPMM